MKRLLRGIIDYGDGAQGREVNFRRLAASNFEWARPEDEKIFRFVSDFFESECDIPDKRILEDFFERSQDVEVTERLREIEATPTHEGSNYKFVLGELLEKQNQAKLRTHLTEVYEIASKGKVFDLGRGKKVTKKGLDEALRHCDPYSIISGPITQPIIRTDLREATYESWDDYAAAKANPGEAYGVFSGFEPLDIACHGLKAGEIWVHAAYSGEMKSTLAQNVAYTAMTRYRRNVVYVSLEMTLKQFRRTVHVMHTTNPRFAGRGGVDYRRARDGELTDAEETLYRDALADFRENDGYSRYETITVAEPLAISSLRRELERIQREMDIGLLVIDHSELLVPPKRDNNHGVEMNSIYHALREISLQFNGGNGLPMLVLHQVNRDGKDAAEKAGGEYKAMRALSWAHEAERSASLITWSYLDDQLRSDCQLRVGCLKNRDNPPFSTFHLDIAWPQRRLTYDVEEALERARQLTEDMVDLTGV